MFRIHFFKVKGLLTTRRLLCKLNTNRPCKIDNNTPLGNDRVFYFKLKWTNQAKTGY